MEWPDFLPARIGFEVLEKHLFNGKPRRRGLGLVKPFGAGHVSRCCTTFGSAAPGHCKETLHAGSRRPRTGVAAASALPRPGAADRVQAGAVVASLSPPNSLRFPASVPSVARLRCYSVVHRYAAGQVLVQQVKGGADGCSGDGGQAAGGKAGAQLADRSAAARGAALTTT